MDQSPMHLVTLSLVLLNMTSKDIEVILVHTEVDFPLSFNAFIVLNEYDIWLSSNALIVVNEYDMWRHV